MEIKSELKSPILIVDEPSAQVDVLSVRVNLGALNDELLLV